MDCKALMMKYCAAMDLSGRPAFLVREEVLDLSGATPDRLDELVDMGWLSPSVTTGEAMLFRLADVYRLRKLERLCADFELPALAGTIIVDLLARIEELEGQLKR